MDLITTLEALEKYNPLTDDHIGINNALVTCETPTHLNYPNLNVLAEVTKAIHQKKMLKVQVRAAVAGYVLRRWNVDCSAQHILTGEEHHLWLQNRQTLYGVENLVIAPGYEDTHTATSPSSLIC